MTTKNKTRQAVIGFCAVDSGQVIITDPSYLNRWQDNAYGTRVPNGDYSYAGACDLTLSNTDNGQMNFPAGHAGLGVVSRTGLGDGYYPVYATFADIDGWGERVVKLEVRFFNDGDLD
jgi:hypothetical protein